MVIQSFICFIYVIITNRYILRRIRNLSISADQHMSLIPKGTRVRYLDIDAPETVHPDKPVQCYGPGATLRNKQLVEGENVVLSRIERGQTIDNSFDNYDRLLANVYALDSNDRSEYWVNAELVWGGFAYDYKRSTGSWFERYFESWELNAKYYARGLWSKCHNLTPQATYMTPTPTP